MTCGRDVIDPRVCSDVAIARAMAMVFSGIVLWLAWNF